MAELTSLVIPYSADILCFQDATAARKTHKETQNCSMEVFFIEIFFLKKTKTRRIHKNLLTDFHPQSNELIKLVIYSTNKVSFVANSIFSSPLFNDCKMI